MQALCGFRATDPLEVLKLLLRRGVRLAPNPANFHESSTQFVQSSPLCLALNYAGRCPFLIHMLIEAGARLAPGEAPSAVYASIAANPAENEAIALRTLLPLYASKLFANEAEQRKAARIWLRFSKAAPETLDALRQLGLRLTPAIRAKMSPVVRRMADAALHNRTQRTFRAAGALVQRQMPREILHMIEAYASEGELWQHGLGSP